MDIPLYREIDYQYIQVFLPFSNNLTNNYTTNINLFLDEKCKHAIGMQEFIQGIQFSSENITFFFFLLLLLLLLLLYPFTILLFPFIFN